MLVEWGPVIPKGKVEITISKRETGGCSRLIKRGETKYEYPMVIDGIEVRRDAYRRYSLKRSAQGSRGAKQNRLKYSASISKPVN